MLNANQVHAKAVELGKHVLRMTTASGSGHPSSALAIGHIIVEIMYRRMRYDLRDPWNPSGDRLVLSIGHAVPIVYAAYADLGGAVGSDAKDQRTLTISELKDLRELHSVLDGHPNPAEGFPFFDAATGSLGQGLSVAVGLALGARLNRIDRRVFAVVGDGEAREGQVWEAVDMAADGSLNNLCAVFSCNGQGQAGPVSAQQSAQVLADKLRAFRWNVVEADGHDPDSLAKAFDRFGKSEQPLAIVARTIKGWGVDLMTGKNYHGKPVDAGDLETACAQLDATGKRLGAALGTPVAPPQPGSKREALKKPATIKAVPFAKALEGAGMGEVLKKGRLATRSGYGVGLWALGQADERIVSLDGDVSNSTYADRFAKAFPDRFIECKIAEQNMVSVAVGLAASGRIPFASSFAKFIARGVDQIDMAAVTRANVKIVGSHSGVSLAADGPSQMGLSDVAYFRSMTRVDNGFGQPLCRLFHPADAICAYRCVELMANVTGLCYLRTHRPEAPFLYPLDESFELSGVKQIREGGEVTLVSSGFMLFSVLDAAKRLGDKGIRCNVFDAYAFPLDASTILSAAERGGGKILTVEDNFIGGLHSEIAEAAAERGIVRVVGMTTSRMPKSARTPEEVFAYVGIGVDQIVERAERLMKRA